MLIKGGRPTSKPPTKEPQQKRERETAFHTVRPHIQIYTHIAHSTRNRISCAVSSFHFELRRRRRRRALRALWLFSFLNSFKFRRSAQGVLAEGIAHGEDAAARLVEVTGTDGPRVFERRQLSACASLDTLPSGGKKKNQAFRTNKTLNDGLVSLLLLSFHLLACARAEVPSALRK